MDTLSAGTVSLLFIREKEWNVPAECPASLWLPTKRFRQVLHRFQQEPKTGWLPVGIAGCFRPESLDDFDWNQWMLSIGISGWLAPEYAHRLSFDKSRFSSCRTCSVL